jgi:arylsulfatase A-like enzyme
MADPVTSVHDPAARISDTERVDLILHTIDNAERPVFIFTHMMDTHGPEFASEQYVFSTGPSSKKWDVNNYLDATLTFDGNAQKIYNHLARTGKLDDTILVIYTDHGFTYTINERIPVVIHFPHDEFSRHVKNNVQVIDIPVTLLGYLDLPQPEWMSGTSLLHEDPPAGRIIFSTTSGDPEKIAPPFYQINIMQGIICDRWYQLDVRKNLFRAGGIANSSAACLPPDEEEVHQTLLKYLEHHGYDIRSLR